MFPVVSLWVSSHSALVSGHPGLCSSAGIDPGGTAQSRRTLGAMAKDPIKDRELYEALREDGASQEKAARIANAAAKTSRSKVGEKGGEAGSYEDWTVDELRKRAAELDIEGRSTMKKDELIEALRNH